MSSFNTNGAIIYRGPSMLNGAPIMIVATGLDTSSTNEKTGDLIQVWILPDNGMTPQQNVDSGADSSVCGDCRHRGTIVDGKNVGRSCYVTIFQAPRNVHDTATRGRYATFTPAETQAAFAGRKVRLGAYGEATAAPISFWDAVLADVAALTGYTHQWALFPEFASYLMASCDTAAERTMAKVLGFRTFRVRTDSDPIEAREIVCPASKEAGYRTNCAACLACGGHSAKARVDIVIAVHGAASKINAFARAA